MLDRGLEWAAGVYYLHDQGFLTSDPLELDVLGIAEVGASPEKDDNESFFLHGNYHITDQLSFEAGYRYTNEWKAYGYANQQPYYPQQQGYQPQQQTYYGR